MATATLTRRGRVVGAVCAIGSLLALAAGGRALDAVVLPGLVALVAGYVQVARVGRPEVHRVQPPDGFVGERHEVRIELRPGVAGAPAGPSRPSSTRRATGWRARSGRFARRSAATQCRTGSGTCAGAATSWGRCG
ncbi:hypothetical protein [Halorubrum sp. PV6]|uniref:hypothetical protein n=1 Tax=Halorubrum sp. PV6 TaxID=634157 RepID=UPI001FCEAE96|nr:hypothetical protein [Halorubrum sp. PV6]